MDDPLHSRYHMWQKPVPWTGSIYARRQLAKLWASRMGSDEFVVRPLTSTDVPSVRQLHVRVLPVFCAPLTATGRRASGGVPARLLPAAAPAPRPPLPRRPSPRRPPQPRRLRLRRPVPRFRPPRRNPHPRRSTPFPASRPRPPPHSFNHTYSRPRLNPNSGQCCSFKRFRPQVLRAPRLAHCLRPHH